MLERFFRFIISLFYKEWSTNSVKSFILLLLVVVYGILNVIYAGNVIAEIIMSTILYIVLLYTNSIIIKKEDEITFVNEEEKDTDITLFVYIILFIIDIFIAIGVPIFAFQSQYDFIWAVFFSLPVMIGCIFVNKLFLEAVDEEE